MTDNGKHGHPGPTAPGSRGWATGTRFSDRYLVGRLIGEGGWAETYEGQDLLLGRTVALKVLRTQFAGDPALVDRFEREARISAAISHPNVVAVYDYGTQDGSFFIALQYIAGEDLKQVVVRQGRIPIPEAIHVAREILRGLDEIHRAGIVHRDVKPQNVLIGKDGLIRITDFGIAHQEIATRVTTHGDAIGTASYMAPEQAQGEEVSPATDIYAAGIVLYELLTGRLPFNRGHAMAILLAHIQEQPVPPSVSAPDASIPPWLDAIVLRAMEKQPEARFSTAAAMIDALERFSRGQDTTAPLGNALRSAAGATATITAAGMRTMAGDTVVSPPPGGAVGRGGRGAPPRPPRPVSLSPGGRSQPARWRRNLALAFTLLAVLAIAAAAVASMMDDDPFGLRGGVDGADPRATEATVPAPPTSTEENTEAGDEEETPDRPEPTATDEPEDEPSETPAPTIPPQPTTVPPRTPTAIPEPSPTETPEPTNTPEPTETPEPPTETPVPVEEEPTEAPDPPAAPVGDVSDQPAEGGNGADTASSFIPANRWAGGAGTRVDDDGGAGDGGQPREVTEIDTSSDDDSVATATFELETVPTGGVMIEIDVRLEDGESSPGALSVAVNDIGMSQPIDLTTNGDRWGVVEVLVPAQALVAGINRIVATASDPSGNADGRANILLGDITISPGGGGGSLDSSGDDATNSDDDDASEPVVVEEDVDASNEDDLAPTIAPR